MLLWKSCSEIPLLVPVLLLVLPVLPVESALKSEPAALLCVGLALPLSALMKLVSSPWLIDPLPLVSIAANSCCSACARPLVLEELPEVAPQALLP